MKLFFKSLTQIESVKNWRDMRYWKKRGYRENSPHFIKQSVLSHYGIKNTQWVETGTYLGETSKFLSKISPKVFTIEPGPKLYQSAVDKFTDTHIEVINGTSEDVFPTLLPKLTGNINFWLDGHYSAGVTFKGEIECPINQELDAISSNLSNFDDVAIFIDDVRCFSDGFSAALKDYPSLDSLVDWARKHNFSWKIEHDIMMMKKARTSL